MKNVQKKSRFKLSTRILSLFLSLVLLFLFVPTVVYAEIIDSLGNDGTEAESTVSDSVSSEAGGNNTPIYTYKGITYEETELREEAVKHFKLEDGSYVAAQYGMPVHYTDESGKWQDIDNSLSEISGVYANDTARIKFAKKITGSAALFTLKNGSTKLEMSLIGANKGSVPTVTNGEDAEAETELQKLMNLEKLSSKIVYPDILDGVDVEYIAHSLNVKENIIVKEKRDSYSYSFELKLNGLTATLAENGDIEIYDKKSGYITCVIPAPVVYDARGIYAPSSASSFSLLDNGNNKYILTVNASAEWINADERVFPITIDPTITYNYSSNYVGRCFSEDNEYTNTNAQDKLYVTQNSISTIHFPVPWGLDRDYIFKVEANLYCQSGSGYVGAFAPSGTWSPEYESWDSLSEMSDVYSATPMDYKHITEAGYYSFDITYMAINCAIGDRPTSFFVLASMTPSTSAVFNNCKEHNGIDYSFTAPYIITEYCNMSGLESYWPTSSHSVGNAGTGTVNLANGNLTFEIPLLSSTDNLMPIGVFAVYNLNRNDQPAYMPTGFRLNIAETLTKKTIEGVPEVDATYYIHTDADGTEHEYYTTYWGGTPIGGMFSDDDGLLKYITVNNDATITMTDDSKIKMHFFPWDGSNWYLAQIEDLSGNKVIINYDTAAKRPTSIALKPNGLSNITMINFHYDTNGKLYMIDNDTSDNAIIFELSDDPTSAEYTAGSSYLRALTLYKGNGSFDHTQWETIAANPENYSNFSEVYSASYSYDFYGYLNQVEDKASNYKIEYEVYDNLYYKILGQILEYSSEVVGKKIDYYYSYYNSTRLTTERSYSQTGAYAKELHYYMDSYGRATCIYNPQTSSSVNYEYENEYKIKNNIKLEYSSPALPKNYLVNTFVSFNNGQIAPYWELENAEFYAEYYHSKPYIVLQPVYDSARATMSQEATLQNGTYTFSFDYIGDNEDNLESRVKIYVDDDEDNVIEEYIATDKNLETGRYSVSFEVKSSSGIAEIDICIESKYLNETPNTDANNDGLLDCNIKINNITLTDGGASGYTNIVNDGTFDTKMYVSYENENNEIIHTYFQSPEFWKVYSKPLTEGANPTEQDLTINTSGNSKYNRLELTGNLEGVVYARQNVYTASPAQLDYFDMHSNKEIYKKHFNFYVGSEIRSNGAVANGDAKFGVYVQISYYQGNGESIKRGIFVEMRRESSFLAQALLDTKCPDDEQQSGKYYGCISAIDLFLVAYKQPNGSKIYFDNVAFVFVDDAPRVENFYNNGGLLEKRIISYDLAEYYEYSATRDLTRVVNDNGAIIEYNYDNKGRISTVETYSFTYTGASEAEATKWQGENENIVIQPNQMTEYHYVLDTNDNEDYGFIKKEITYPFHLDDDGNPQQPLNVMTYKVFREFEMTPGSKIFGALSAEGSGYETDNVNGPVQYTLSLRDCNNAKRYFYEEKSGRLSAEVSINGNSGMEYCYNDKGELTSVFPAVYDMESSVESYDANTDENYALYFYNDENQLTRMHTNNVLYNFVYGDFGNVTQVGINYSPKINYEYYDKNGNLKKITYENDFVQNFVYNKLDLLSEIWYTEIDRENGSPAYTYEYDKLSRLFKVRDYTINPDSPLITEYEYNDDGAISKVSRYTNEESPVYINTVSQTYDKNNRVSAIKRTTFYDSGKAGYIHTLRTYAYSYNSYGSLTKYALESGDSGTTDSREYYSVQYSYDDLNRLSGITSTGVSSADELTDYFHNFTMNEGFVYENTNVYAYNVTVTDASNNTNSTANTYQYDANGNITKIITTDTAGEYSHEYRYYYDNLGQLIRVDDARENRTVVYTYDDAGNITKKERYALTAAGATPSGTSTVYNYTYGNSAWSDQLTAYNGTSITYDAIGNPLSYYNGAAFEWEGRQLVSAVYNSNTYTYTYDDNGMRSSRTKHLSDGTTEVTNYTYNGNLLVSEETNGYITLYIYDPSGSPIGFQYRNPGYAAGVWDTYYYGKNIQGDIVRVYDSDGNTLIWYYYDEYGAPSCELYSDGMTALKANHLMYRGYYYDFDRYSLDQFTGGLGLYYLGSRYYDQNIGRFISPDDFSYLGANGDLNAYNLYAYCSNNPVMYSDPSGHSILAAIIIGAVVGGVLGFGTVAYTDYQDDGEVFNGSVEWYEYVGGTATGAFLGAGTSGIIAVGGKVLSAAISSVTNKCLSDVFANSLTGTSFGTWEDYAIAFLSGGLLAGKNSVLKTIYDVLGRPAVNQVVKIGTNRQSTIKSEKYLFDVMTRGITTLAPASSKPFYRGGFRSLWDLMQRGYFSNN